MIYLDEAVIIIRNDNAELPVFGATPSVGRSHLREILFHFTFFMKSPNKFIIPLVLIPFITSLLVCQMDDLLHWERFYEGKGYTVYSHPFFLDVRSRWRGDSVYQLMGKCRQ